MSYPSLWRLVAAQQVAADDFDSHAKQGKMPPNKSVDLCRWASCSFFTSKARLQDLVALPKMRAKYSWAAEVSVPTGAGVSKSHNAHVDLWMWASFDPVSAVVAVAQV
ncbi:hypothetical protein [Methylobacterium oryzae]|uniref:hypothetical protein n=1 Tax=Methylobacterium oryzae TaxID=334852 RepID=UPI002F359469